MIITYFGKEFFKIQLGDTIIAFNPISKDSKLKTSRFGADIALITTNHPDYNGVENLSFGEKEPFVARGPGEYETKNIFIKGISSGPKGENAVLNTIYILSVDKMNICFLGALSSKIFSPEAREEIDSVDILFVPLNGGSLTPSDSYAIAVSLEPKIIIPMDYDENTLKKFLKEGGEEKIEPLDKLTVKQKDVEGKEGEIVVIASSA